jgi:2-iminobutanoate/2-iminopropanoate deaminase
MTAQSTPSSPAGTDEPATSRRDLVAAAVTLAATAAVAPTAAQAQTPPARHSNPQGMAVPAAYSQVVEVNGPHRIVFLAGQTGHDANGKLAAGGIRGQATQIMENIKTALASVGGGFEHLAIGGAVAVDVEHVTVELDDMRASYFSNKSALPASTLLQVSRLANPDYLLEVEALAILPPKA